MKHGRMGTFIASGTAAASAGVAEAQAAPLMALAGQSPLLDSHPVFSVVAHIVFIAVIVGIGASIVAVLFKSPFQQ